MAHGKTLELQRVTDGYLFRRAQLAGEHTQRGNPDHYFPSGGRVFTHARVRPELGNRRKYRAIVRRERMEAEALREKARSARVGPVFTLDDNITERFSNRREARERSIRALADEIDVGQRAAELKAEKERQRRYDTVQHLHRS